MKEVKQSVKEVEQGVKEVGQGVKEVEQDVKEVGQDVKGIDRMEQDPIPTPVILLKNNYSISYYYWKV